MSEIERLQIDMGRLEVRLANASFLKNAPEEVLVEVVKLYKKLQLQLHTLAPEPPPERSVIKIVRNAQ